MKCPDCGAQLFAPSSARMGMILLHCPDCSYERILDAENADDLKEIREWLTS
jgi:DNA-directed RNA polymerase subunit RPC12/RpoP